MAGNVNRRDFLKILGATGAAAAVNAGINLPVRAQEISTLDGLNPIMCGSWAPLDETQFPGADGTMYPYPDPKTGEMLYHPTLREAPYPELMRTPLSQPVDLMSTFPERVESEGGFLDLELVAKMATVMINGQAVTLRAYNGSFPGPTMVAKPGDILRVRHVNEMPANPNTGPHHNINHPHGFNDINLHTHGINGSPSNNEDNPLIVTHPGESFDYEIAIHDKHATGTYWYHPHKHGATSLQVGSGMAGFLLVEDGENDIRSIPEIGAAKEVLLMFQEIYIADNPDGTGYVPDFPTDVFPFYYELTTRMETTVNGVACNEIGMDGSVIVPELHMRPGEVQHWRMAHAGIFANWNFGIDDHEVHIVAYDGLMPETIETVDSFEFVSGQRRDLLVKANMQPGTYAVKRLASKQSEKLNTWPEKTLFHIVVSGEPMDMALPTKLKPVADILPYITDDEVVAKRTVSFEFVDDTGANLFLHLIDNKVFKPGRVDYTMGVGTAEEWEVCNDLVSDHPFHIHVNWFELHKVVDKDGNETRFDPPIWMDTVNVPRNGSVTIRHRFDHFQGMSVLHCHILPHEDEGMMSTIDIVDMNPKTTTISPAGGLLISPEYDHRVMVDFKEETFATDTEVTYQYMSPANKATVNPAPAIADGMADYERYFQLTAEQDGEAVTEMASAAVFNIKYSAAQVDTYVPMSTIKLYRFDEATEEWTTEGISLVARTDTTLTCTTKHTGYFAVLGTPDLCVDFVGHNGVGPEDIEHILRYQNSPYRYLIGQYDLFPLGSPDGVIDGQDVRYVYTQLGQFCKE